MATEKVTAGDTQEVITEYYTDHAWTKLDDRMPPGVWRRLACVDRNLFACNVIMAMLLKDRYGKDDADGEIDFAGALSPLNAEALRIAAAELGARAEGALGEIRENEHDCCGPAIYRRAG